MLTRLLPATAGCIFFAVSVYFLFFFHPDLPDLRSVDALWNLSHIAFFFLTVYIFLSTTKTSLVATLSKRAYFKYAAITGTSAALAGLAIELIQMFVGRSASLQDLLFDTAGALLAFVYVTPARFTSHRAFASCVWVLGIICTTPFLLVSYDEYVANRQFPVLSAFNSKLELTRLDADVPIKIENRQLHVTFMPKLYANVSWEFFPRDWRDYRWLNIALNNLETEQFKLHCRIHDKAHEKNLAYDDRFHQGFMLIPGEQIIKMDLHDVIRAPRTRRMNMREVAALICFTHKLDTPRRLVFDEVRLQR